MREKSYNMNDVQLQEIKCKTGSMFFILLLQLSHRKLFKLSGKYWLCIKYIIYSMLIYMWYSIFLYPLLDWRCFNLNIKFRCICIVFSQLHTNKLSKIFRGLPIAALRLKTLGLKHGSFSIYICEYTSENLTSHAVSQINWYAYHFKQWLRMPLSRCDRQIQKAIWRCGVNPWFNTVQKKKYYWSLGQ